MKHTAIMIAVAVGFAAVVATSFVEASGDRTPVEFVKGHTHDGLVTHGAPQHSGGLDRNGCHNASVPYHCH